jgi:S-adenosylmethionine:diacylglycerol 3-amino-3-carboxypropyl transferase
MALAPSHEVVAVDLHPLQIAYARARFEGGPTRLGAAERLLGLGRSFARLAGWRRGLLADFLELDDPAAQIEFWRGHLDTRRFRAGFDALLSMASLRRVYAASFLDILPRRFGPVLRERLARGFASHPNRTNPYAKTLLLGGGVEGRTPREARTIRPVCADVAGFLEREPAASFDGFALSNVLDGAPAAYERRVVDAVRRAAAPGATVVLRSFREPRAPSAANRAGEDRSMLWGIVQVRSAATFEGNRGP